MAKHDRQRLMTHIRAMIGCGTFRPGDKLPSLRALAEQFGMTVSTARNALLELEQDGLVNMRQGDGNYVGNGGHKEAAPPKWKIAVFTENVNALEPTHTYGAHALLGLQERAAECDCRIEIFFSDFYHRHQPLRISKDEIAGKDAMIFLGVYDWNPLELPPGIPGVGLLMGEMYAGQLSNVGLDYFVSAELACRYFRERNRSRVKCFYFDFGSARNLFHVFREEFRPYGVCEGVVMADNHPALENFADPDCGYLILSGTVSHIVQQAYRAKHGRIMTGERTLLSVDGKSRYLPDFEPIANIGIDWRQAGRTLLDEAIFRITNPTVPGRRIFMLPDLQDIKEQGENQ
ncbi:MAG: winged helix-turn-helix domain-containing protein [Victivallaceae bacterium]